MLTTRGNIIYGVLFSHGIFGRMIGYDLLDVLDLAYGRLGEVNQTGTCTGTTTRTIRQEGDRYVLMGILTFAFLIGCYYGYQDVDYFLDNGDVQASYDIQTSVETLIALDADHAIPLKGRGNGTTFFMDQDTLLRNTIGILKRYKCKRAITIRVTCKLRSTIGRLSRLHQAILNGDFKNVLYIDPEDQGVGLGMDKDAYISDHLIRLGCLGTLLRGLLDFFFRMTSYFLDKGGLDGQRRYELRGNINALARACFDNCISDIGNMRLGIILYSMSLDLYVRLFEGLVFVPLTISRRCTTQLCILCRSRTLLCMEKIITNGRINLICVM